MTVETPTDTAAPTEEATATASPPKEEEEGGTNGDAPTTTTTPTTSTSDFEKEQKHREELNDAGKWDKDSMMHHEDPNAPKKPVETPTPTKSPADADHPPHGHGRGLLQAMSARSLGARRASVQQKGGSIDPTLWGVPGHLTEEEVNTFMEFQKIVESKGGEFKKTIYSFGEVEGEPWALCRWLRARKFVLKDVLEMVEGATKEREAPGKFDFYPDPKVALGCDPGIFLAQYPQLYSGKAMNGCPVFISKPGVLNVDGIECITTMEGILRYHWHVMQHDYGSRLRAEKSKNHEFKRFECFCILDLAELSTSQLTSKALAIVKDQSRIDSLCFPETMNKMVIVNAPVTFSMTWKLIRGWLDPRTAAKVELMSNRTTWEKRLLELINKDQLPSDYGGSAEATTSTLLRDASVHGGMKRRELELMRVRTSGTYTIDVANNEKMELVVFTRSTSGGKFDVTDEKRKTSIVKGVEVKHLSKGGTSDNEPPTSVTVVEDTVGPATLKVKVTSSSGRFSTDNFLLVCNIHPAS